MNFIFFLTIKKFLKKSRGDLFSIIKNISILLTFKTIPIQNNSFQLLKLILIYIYKSLSFCQEQKQELKTTNKKNIK